jgi:hypothetical protein
VSLVVDMAKLGFGKVLENGVLVASVLYVITPLEDEQQQVRLILQSGSLRPSAFGQPLSLFCAMGEQYLISHDLAVDGQGSYSGKILPMIDGVEE